MNFSQSVIQTDMEYIKYYSELRIENTERMLQTELLKEFDVDVVVCLQWALQDVKLNGISMEQIRITRIDVEFQKEYDEERKQSVRAYLTKNYCSEVQIE